MAVDKEQSNGEVYSEEDRKLIISLLNEYAEKLLNACDQIDKQRRRSRLFILLCAGLTPSALLLFYASGFFYIADFISALIFSLLILVSLFIITTIYDGKRKLALLARDAKIMATKLEKLIRAASQAQEHILINFASRIELDLRLADAESAIQHYTILMKDRKLFQLF